VLEKSIERLNKVSISVCLGLGLVLWLRLVLGLVSGLMPFSYVVLISTVLSSSCIPRRLTVPISVDISNLNNMLPVFQ